MLIEMRVEERRFGGGMGGERFLVRFGVGIRRKGFFCWVLNGRKEYGWLWWEWKIGGERGYRRMVMERRWVMGFMDEEE